MFGGKKTMEIFLGRTLRGITNDRQKSEIVHHIDFDRKNNSLDNFFVLTSTEHGKAHSSLNKTGRYLFKKGVIIFNKEKKVYELNHKWKILLK